METSPIIAELDPPRNVFSCFLARRVGGPVHQLDFQRAVHGFGEGVVVAYPGASDRLAYLQPVQLLRELARGVVASAVAVEYRSVRQIEVPGGHLDGVFDERRLVVVVHPPPHYLPVRPIYTLP